MAIGSKINSNFPIPGIDQSSRGFRDNFATIKREIETLQGKKIRLAGDVESNSVEFGNGQEDIILSTTVIAPDIDAANLSILYNLNNAISGTDMYYNSGDIGIGTSSPREKLDVVGNARISGNIICSNDLSINGILFSDGTFQTTAGGNVSIDGTFPTQTITAIADTFLATVEANSGILSLSNGDTILIENITTLTAANVLVDTTTGVVLQDGYARQATLPAVRDYVRSGLVPTGSDNRSGFFTDFYESHPSYGGTGGGVFNVANSGMATSNIIATASAPFGVAYYSTGASSSGSGFALWPSSGNIGTNGVTLGIGEVTWAMRARLPQLSNSADIIGSSLGLIKHTDRNHTDDAVSFEYDPSAGGSYSLTNWVAVCRKNGTATVADTGVSADTLFHVFEINLPSSGNSAVFMVDGTGVAEINSNIPTGSGNVLGIGHNIHKHGGSVGTTLCYLLADWVYFHNDVSTRATT